MGERQMNLPENGRPPDGGKLKRLLVVDDEPNMAWLFRQTFSGKCEVIAAESGERALDLVKQDDVDVVMLDLRLPGMDGMETLREMKRAGLTAPVIIMTAYGEVKSAVQAMKLGAFDYITKPFDLEELVVLVEGALQYSALTREVSRLKEELREKFNFDNIVTVSPKMISIFSVIERVCQSDVSVLIQGESGTGKELIARAIHHASPRRDKPFVPVNCAALPESLLESELFGHEEGAFTGARKRKPGKFEMADGGTLFLDEVGDLPLSMQPKILRAIEEKVIERLGGTRRIPVDVRVVAATNRDLRKEVHEGRFRQDLYFRLAVIPIYVPPLRERREDIPVLVRHFLKEFCEKRGKTVPEVDDEAMRKLVSYDWPGNVRELKNAMEQICFLCDGKRVFKKDLPPLFGQSPSGEDTGSRFAESDGSRSACEPRRPGDFSDPEELKGAGGLSRFQSSLAERKAHVVSEAEREAIRKALEAFGGNRTRAARHLGVSRRTLQLKIKKYRL